MGVYNFITHFITYVIIIATVTFGWTPNNPSEQVTHYTLYRYWVGESKADGEPIATFQGGATGEGSIEITDNDLRKSYFFITANNITHESGPSNVITCINNPTCNDWLKPGKTTGVDIVPF